MYAAIDWLKQRSLYHSIVHFNKKLSFYWYEIKSVKRGNSTDSRSFYKLIQTNSLPENTDPRKRKERTKSRKREAVKRREPLGWWEIARNTSIEQGDTLEIDIWELKDMLTEDEFTCLEVLTAINDPSALISGINIYKKMMRIPISSQVDEPQLKEKQIRRIIESLNAKLQHNNAIFNILISDYWYRIEKK